MKVVKKEIVEKSKRILLDFVKSMGYNENAFENFGEVPVFWDNIEKYNDEDEDAVGAYVNPTEITAKFNNYNDIISSIDENTKKTIDTGGFIILDESLMNNEGNYQLYLTLIHEMIHSYRNLFIQDKTDWYNAKNVEFETEFFEKDSDASQDILKGHLYDEYIETIDDCEMTTEEKGDKLDEMEKNIRKKLDKQKEIDESLVECISILAYKNNILKTKGEQVDIWKNIEQLKEATKDGDRREKNVSLICEIMMKHHNLDLIKWIFFPLESEFGDVHYDYFENYTKNDQEIKERIEYNCENKKETKTISKKDIEDVAIPKEAEEQVFMDLSPELKRLIFVKDYKKDYKDDEER